MLASSAFAQNAVVLEKHVVNDPVAVNREAFTFLKPQGWTVTGGITWYMNSSHQNCVELKVANPQGLEQIECLPYTNFSWFTNPVIPMQVGQNYMGEIIHRPMDDPKEIIRTLTLPYVRSGLNARITGYEELPDVAKSLSQSMGGAHVRSGRVRVEYAVNGRAVEEDFYLSVYVTSANLGVNNCVAYKWGPAWQPFSLRAAKGELDAKTPLLLSIAGSARLNPHWFGECEVVRGMFQDRMAKGIQMARDLSDYIRRNSDEIFRMTSDAYWARQASQDRLAQNFSDHIRDVTRYTSPFERYPVQLPSGYQYAWTSQSGGYILSNDANYDPNVGGTGNWQQIQQVR